jgi:DNA-binding CsgD family transcriptional regulator
VLLPARLDNPFAQIVIPSLPAADLKALRAVNEALLDPLSHDKTETWLLHVCARFKTLCHGHASLAGLSFREEDARWISRDLPQKYLERLAELAGPVPGSLRSSDPAVEALVDGPRRRHSGVAMSADLLEGGRIRVDDLKESPMFRDVALPVGLPGSAFLFHSGASGEFAIHTSYPEMERRPFGAITQEVLSALLPAFAASVGALARLGNARRAIAVLLDALDDGAVVFDPGGQRVLARNRAMTNLGQIEANPSGLEGVILDAARAAAWPITVAKSGSGALDPGALSRAWRSPTGLSYRLRAVRLPSGSLSPREAILVLVQRVGPPIPAQPELMRRFGFTRREADVAHRLAYGCSDREIAAELGLSAFTVRHHVEAVFVKAGVTTRKALALHLGSPPP